MKNKTPVPIAASLVLAVAVSVANAQVSTNFRSISKAEMELLLQDVAKSNPAALKRFTEDPEMKKEQLESIKQLLAFATQAHKDGFADDPINRRELENIRAETTAVNYDKELNKNKGPMPPFSFISEARIKSFWTASPTAKSREAEFQQFMDSKL
ncbi:MAG TPA: hypothetical protein VJ781_13100, partial [Pyrinomonadaceae bacterium]|nr:hypothetical protein [Pyrinomonadaceae bacterium]